MFSFLIRTLLIFLFRFNRLFVQAPVWCRVKPIALPKEPSLSNKDVTVVIPTICADGDLESFKRTLESINGTNPHGIIVVTPAARVETIRNMATAVNKTIEVVGSSRTSKRYQLWLGIAKVRTEIAVLADDDVEWRWKTTAMSHLLAPFADTYTGAVGTCQRVERTSWWNPVEFLGALYITRRNQEITATSRIDGGLSCLSGRTLAIRTTLVQQTWFREKYLGEKWHGLSLNPDDDNFITRWVFSGKYKIQIQSAEDVVVHTTLGTTCSSYIAQCIRWERSRWRHTFTLLTAHPGIWTRQPWSTWALYFQVLFHSLWTDPAMAFCWYRCKGSFGETCWLSLTTLLVAFGLFAKFFKTVDHYQRNPKDLPLLPIAIAFGYLHGLIKLYALCTLSNVAWGSRHASEDGTESFEANTPFDAVLSHSLSKRRPVVVSTSRNTLRFGDGSTLFDASGGAGVTCLGYGVRPVRKALSKAPVAYVLDRDFSTVAVEQYAIDLLKTTSNKFSKAYFCSSGSDAVETSIKLARQYHVEKGEEGRVQVIACGPSYHGFTLTAAGIGCHVQRRKIYEPLLPGNVSHVSACYPYRDRGGLSDEQYVTKKAQELDGVFKTLGPRSVVAFIVEPVAGATLGCVPTVPGYLAAMGAVCRKHGALIIFDEIMCGFGRTGRLHAWERDGFAPDIQVLGKGLGAGEQVIAAVLCNKRIENTIRDGSGQFAHGFTFQNNALACTAGHEVLRIIRDDRLLDNVNRLAPVLMSGLVEELGNHPNVGDIRGEGFFVGIEFVREKDTKTPFSRDLQTHERVHDKAREKGLLVYNANGTADGVNGDHIIIAPAFICTRADIRFIITTLASAIKEAFEPPEVKIGE